MSVVVCPTCGEKTVTVERGSGGYIEILAAPSAAGTFMRLPHGRHAGQYVKVEGPLLDKLRVNGTHLFSEHGCQESSLFDA